MITTFSLQSGSCGNCLYVEGGGRRLLVDAGLAAREIVARLARHGRRIGQIDGILLTHDHLDHIRAAGTLQRRLGIPIYATRGTFRGARRHCGELAKRRFFRAGQTFPLGDLRIETIPIPHDARDAVSFVIQAGDYRLGIFTDLGRPTPQIQAALASVDAAYLESNYDPEMLRTGPYPTYLKVRIRGGRGHISNEQAAAMLAACDSGRLQWVALSHLSGENNHPRVALDTHRAADHGVPIWVASRRQVSALHHVRHETESVEDRSGERACDDRPGLHVKENR